MATSIATGLQVFFYNCWLGEVSWRSNWDGTVFIEFYHNFPVRTTEDIIIIFAFGTLMGAIGGCLGSLFINVNTLVNIQRRRYLTTKRSKVIECVIFCMITSSVVFWFSYMGNCQPIIHTEYSEEFLQVYRGWCPAENENGDTLINAIASYYWSSSEQIENHYIHHALKLGPIPMRQFLFFFGFWYFFFLFSYGTNLPAGLFSPGIVMGIAYGQIWFKILADPNYIGKDVDPALQRKFMCIGCVAIISPYVRLKYSVSVILLEIW